MTYDVAIIGGGPAGAAAALSLRQLMPKAAIAIFDRGAEGWIPGEILSPGAKPILQSLGCWSAFCAGDFLESFGTRAAWGSYEAYENEFLFSLRGNGWRLDRARFDGMLRDCARAGGVEILEGVLLDSSGDQTGWRLQFRGFDRNARFVIDASGRAAAFAVQRGARRIADDRLAGAFVRFETEDAGDTLIEATETGWWYSATVPQSTAVAAFMTDTDLLRQAQLYDDRRWKHLLSGSRHTRERLRNSNSKTSPAVFTAHSQRLSMIAGPGWVAAGDAAMAFDPLSSQGILKALGSGKMASFVAADFLLREIDSHERYQRLGVAEYAAYEKAKREFYAMETRWPEAVFWKRRWLS